MELAGGVKESPLANAAAAGGTIQPIYALHSYDGSRSLQEMRRADG